MTKWRIMPGLTVVTLIALVTLCWLGVWQLQRAEWKRDLLANLAQRELRDPVNLQAALKDPNPEFTRVALEGNFLSHPPFRMRMVRDGVAGNQLISGFRTGGQVVLVDMGFAPDGQDFTPPGGVQSLLGRIHPDEPRGMKPQADLDGNVWYWRDLATMGRALGMPVAPVMIELEDALPGGPQATPLDMTVIPNRHFAYALTWFAFAIVLLAIYILLHLRPKR